MRFTCTLRIKRGAKRSVQEEDGSLSLKNGDIVGTRKALPKRRAALTGLGERLVPRAAECQHEGRLAT